MSKQSNTLAKRLRYIPFACTLVMCAHCATLLAGCASVIPELLLGLLVFYILMRVSHCLGYCLLHRLGLIYGYAVYFCCNYERLIGFGEARQPMQWLMMTLGIVLLVGYVLRYIKKECK